MGISDGRKKRNLSVSMNADMSDDIIAMAKEAKISKSAMCRILLSAQLNVLKRESLKGDL